jgi:mannose-1-phosphate guanylyltransferase
MLKATGRRTRRDKYFSSTTMGQLHRVSLLLAGGDGTRLQDLTREIAGEPIPKQYCPLFKGSSLLEATITRAQLFSPRNQINVIVNQSHLSLARNQLQMLPKDNIFVQPLNRDTGPGLIFALLQLQRVYPDAIVAVFPTDHYVENDLDFIAHVRHAADTISLLQDKIAILGIVPERPETSYGYILPAAPLKFSRNIYHVEAFMEKPNSLHAGDIIAQGGLWNTFVMIFRLSRMMELLQQYAPCQFAEMSELRDVPEKAAKIYHSIDSWNLSTHFLARIPQHLVMVEVADVEWSDWGTRESIERTYRSLNIVPFWNLTQSCPKTATG